MTKLARIRWDSNCRLEHLIEPVQTTTTDLYCVVSTICFCSSRLPTQSIMFPKGFLLACILFIGDSILRNAHIVCYNAQNLSLSSHTYMIHLVFAIHFTMMSFTGVYMYVSYADCCFHVMTSIETSRVSCKTPDGQSFSVSKCTREKCSLAAPRIGCAQHKHT